jgi:hypothetical protein
MRYEAPNMPQAHWISDLGLYGLSGAFLQISPNPIIWIANPQMCETYDLWCSNALVFALESKSAQILHLAP